MYGVVKRLDIDFQKQILEDCRSLLSAAPLYSNYAPRRGIGRRDCSGNCEICFTGNVRTAKYKNTNFGPWGYYGRPCGARYVHEHPTTGEPFPPIPASILDICKDVADEYGYDDYDAQSAYLSYYPLGSAIGRHQDYEEKVNMPVISISLGEDGIFEFGKPERFGSYEDIILRSGDVFLFGGEHRYCYHSVRKVIPDTKPADLIMEPVRISITIRQYE